MITNMKPYILKWFKKTFGGEERPVLQAISANAHVEATNGFKIHRLNMQLTNQTGEVITGLFLSENNELEPDTRGLTYPNLDEVTPKTKVMVHQNPNSNTKTKACFRVGITAKYLADALSVFSGFITIVFISDSSPIEIFGRTKDGEEAYVLLMPAHHKSAPSYLWRSNNNVLKVREEKKPK